MFPFVRAQDNSQVFLLIQNSFSTDEANGSLSIATGVAQGTKL